VRTTDIIDPSVGISEVAGLGTAVGPGGPPLCIVHAANKAAASQAEAAILAAMTIGPMPEQGMPARKNPIAARITER
jgi:thymidine phosphorylase